MEGGKEQCFSKEWVAAGKKLFSVGSGDSDIDNFK